MPRSRALSHVTPAGTVRMVDVAAKPDQRRVAVARGEIRLLPATLRRLRRRALPKGDVLATAQIAGIQAAKRTSDLIPLCHPLPLSSVDLDFAVKQDRVVITATARCTGPTGVEMEALTAVSVAALTLYDMTKAVDSTMEIGAIRLVSKSKS